jgi:succinate dehydrogenase flavin-adding protein (antitoxin of CptAB toxin-antitoxin module)
MAIKNAEVMRQIEEMLYELKKQDKQQYNIILALLGETFVEYNTGKSKSIDKKLYEMIDAEVRYKTQKN